MWDGSDTEFLTHLIKDAVPLFYCFKVEMHLVLNGMKDQGRMRKGLLYGEYKVQIDDLFVIKRVGEFDGGHVALLVFDYRLLIQFEIFCKLLVFTGFPDELIKEIVMQCKTQ